MNHQEHGVRGLERELFASVARAARGYPRFVQNLDALLIEQKNPAAALVECDSGWDNAELGKGHGLKVSERSANTVPVKVGTEARNVKRGTRRFRPSRFTFVQPQEPPFWLAMTDCLDEEFKPRPVAPSLFGVEFF